MRLKNLLGDVSIKCSLFMMAYYVTNSVFQSFIALYYASDRMLTDAQIGLINSMIALVSVFSMQFWGARGDRAKSRNRLLAAMSLCAAACMLIFQLAASFWTILILISLFSAFYTSLQPMGDSIILPSLEREGRPFGPVRMVGGVSFAIVAMLFGRVLDAFDNNAIVLYTVSALCVLIALAALGLPKVKGEQKPTEKRGMLELFKNKDLVKLFLLMMPLQISLGYFYAFFSPLFKNDLPGGSSSLLGWCYFISAMSEIPFLLNADKLFKKHGAGRLMCISAATLSVRWLLVASAKSVYVAMASQLLHFWGFIVITVTMAKYIQSTVPKELKASGQLLLSVFGFGVARVIGYLGGALLSGVMGRQGVFYALCALCALTFVVFAPYYFRRPPLSGAQDSANMLKEHE